MEFNNGTADEIDGHMGWYYVTLAVDGKIRAHLETGLKYDIADGKVSEMPKREQYFTAGGLKGADVDYVFNNVGFSSASTLYTLQIPDDVLKRAEKTLAERSKEKAAAGHDKDIRPQKTPSKPGLRQNPSPAINPPRKQKIVR